ncbi:MAG: SRPBCC family protein [Planctomycetota bacterium]
MIRKLLLGFAVFILALIVVVALQPSEFQVSRSMKIAAPVPAVFAKVNDFHEWDAWSPWAKLDPNMKQTYEGSPTGKGAIYSWDGNDQVGKGKMTITDSKPEEQVLILLEFERPIAATNAAAFTFKPEGDQTVVTWSMSGTNGFIAKAFHLVMNIDKLLGEDFEKGLTKLKEVVEGTPKPPRET